MEIIYTTIKTNKHSSHRDYKLKKATFSFIFILFLICLPAVYSFDHQSSISLRLHCSCGIKERCKVKKSYYISLTYFMPLVSFLTPRQHKKT